MVFFVHIEKAGGTSIHYSLLSTFKNYLILPPLKKGYGWRYDAASLQKISKWMGPSHFYGGHQVSSIPDLSDFTDNARYFTFLREPLSRYISHVNWILHTRPERSLDEFLSSNYLSNVMCFRISGQGDFQTAKKHLLKKKYFVGLIENFDESMFLLPKWLQNKESLYYAPSNVLEDDDKTIVWENLSKSQKKRITKNNSEDILLYNYVNNSLFPKQRQELGFDKEKFEAWIHSNKGYSNSIWRIYKSKLKSKIIKSIL